MKRISVLLVVLACVLTLSAQKKDKSKAASGEKASSASADLWAGTWKLNPAKSKLLGQAPGEVTIKIDAADANSVKYTVTEKDASGAEHTESYDGKPGVESALTRDGQEEGKITYHRISARHSTAKESMGDGSSGMENITMAPDGKSFTVKAQIKDSKGVHQQTEVFEKQ
ncbi:MAG TPA: hypothetical protein VJN64_16235 [Terriglobales bacterium]|nr:hypothetical protein [Terriglobales bacterium]